MTRLSKDDLIIIGLATQEEIRLFHSGAPTGRSPMHVQVCLWAQDLVYRMYDEGTVESGLAVDLIIKQLIAFRGNLAKVLFYDSLNVPLVYTQASLLVT